MENKTIKIRFVGFWEEFDAETFSITQILRKHFDVRICDDADYIICSCIGRFYEFLKYPQVRIMYIGENYIPDLNMVDYAITPYPISFLDRCFHYPQGLRSPENLDYCTQRSNGTVRFDASILEQKTRFANFCASHESEYGKRGNFFKELCEYKKVDSIGTYLNNTGVTVKRTDGSKVAYQKSCKFTLCFESTAHGGFNTEKIVDAFCSDTIPVYYGDPYIGDVFNKNAFINVGDYACFGDAIEAVKKLDQDDDAYLRMLNEPVFTDPAYPERLMKEYEEFILHIFRQSPEQAYRRSRAYFAHYYDSYVTNVTKTYYLPLTQKLLRIKNIIKK